MICLRCENEITDKVAKLFVPGEPNYETLCLSCALTKVDEYWTAQGKVGKKRALIVKPKEDPNDVD